MKFWIEAARPKTLPLAISSILAGNFIAIEKGVFSYKVIVFSILTAVLLQILSNFANDYGDYTKGTDSKDRIGPRRAVTSGDIAPGKMIGVIIAISFLTLVSGILLLYFGNSDNPAFKWILLGLGILSILAAITYTVGKNPYGYRALGDFAVLIFFGLLAVLGTIILQTGKISYLHILPATGFGLLAVAVLNINNVRDYESDKNAGKKTIPVLVGLKSAKNYQIVLNLLASILILIYTIITSESYWQYIYVIALIPLFLSTASVVKNFNPADLNNELKRQSLSTFLLSALFSIGLII